MRALFAIFFLLAVAAACGRAEQGFLKDLRDDHAAIDALVDQKDFESAEKRIERALDASIPSHVGAGRARVLKQDLYYRLALVQLEKGEAEKALASTGRGLELGKHEDVFTANVLIARGNALEVLERKSEATDAYYEALTINDRLLKEVLHD